MCLSLRVFLGQSRGDVDLHEPASVGTLGSVSLDAGVQEHVSIPGSVSVDVPGPVSVDIPAGPVNVEIAYDRIQWQQW